MVNKNIIALILFIFFVSSLLSQDKYKFLVYKQITPSKAIINWGVLLYSADFFTYIDISNSRNFIQESLFKSEEFIQEVRKKVFKDILSININYEITIKDLLTNNNYFFEEFTKRFYSSDIIIFSGQIGDKIKMISNIQFLGSNNLIDLILKSGYFFENLKLQPINSEYTPYNHSGLVIEARHLDVIPSLFPNIYSYDENGNIVLIYSVNHSSKKDIIINGYARFYTDFIEGIIENENFYYCAAVKSYGTKKVDFIISREDYIKFFSSPLSLKRLSEGNFYIIIDPKKVKM